MNNILVKRGGGTVPRYVRSRYEKVGVGMRSKNGELTTVSLTKLGISVSI